MKTAFLFPGQGAQFVGMGKDLYENHPVARRMFDKANQIVEFDIAKICFEGPDTELNKTNICQPAILIMSLVSLAVWNEKDGDPDNPIVPRNEAERGKEIISSYDASAGLSLGEYTALAANGALSFEDAVHIVERRGTFMQEACDQHPSGMVSVIGLERAKLEEICKTASAKGGVVNIANLNSPGQIAISGDNETLKTASEMAKAAGARKVIPLKVAGAFHSALMKPAEEKLKIELDKIKINTITKPVISNVTADYVRTPDEIKRCLARQVTSPVLWEDSMRRLVKEGVKEFYEIGPGNVLTGLMQRIDSTVTCRKV
ncbi:MAG: ACP S-malonyltransferase [Planctomycetes bacterium]|nr:ACP S-malonyltransferase [Planctomycetota bacterium]